MSLKLASICATVILHLSLCGRSNGFSTNLAPKQLQRYDQYSGDGSLIDGVVLSMAKAPGGSDQLSKVEALLAKAKLLRAQAEADTTELQSSLLEKKASRDTDMDSTINELFKLDSKERVTKKFIAESLTKQRMSSDLLLRVVERLHQREIAAKGLDHVESSRQGSRITFKTTNTEDKEELARIEGLVETLIDAAQVVDDDFVRARNENKKVVVNKHWSTGELSKVLREKRNFLNREYDEQFKKRQEEFYEAARKKEDITHTQIRNTKTFEPKP